MEVGAWSPLRPRSLPGLRVSNLRRLIGGDQSRHLQVTSGSELSRVLVPEADLV